MRAEASANPKMLKRSPDAAITESQEGNGIMDATQGNPVQHATWSDGRVLSPPHERARGKRERDKPERDEHERKHDCDEDHGDIVLDNSCQLSL